MKKDYDIKFMNYAINLSHKNYGITGKNPSVGCVIAYDNKIIATGVTNQGGRPHAEKIAIDKVADKKTLKKSTLYVSLEPCCKNDHNGITCCDYIIKNNISRVVIGTKDSNPQINGKSIEKLRKHNIEVVTNILTSKAQKINHFFQFSQKYQRPFVTLKIATSLDGKIATKNFDSKWITSKGAREYSHFLRASYDGILVGANTLRIDNPQLNCRLKNLESHSPKIFILSQKMDFDHNLQIFSQENAEIYLISPNSWQNIEKFNKIKSFNQNLNHITFENEYEYLNKIYQFGIKSLLVEGGSNIATQFIKDYKVDRIIWIGNKKIIGNDGLSAINNLDVREINQAINNYKIVKFKALEEDFMLILDNVNRLS